MFAIRTPGHDKIKEVIARKEDRDHEVNALEKKIQDTMFDPLETDSFNRFVNQLIALQREDEADRSWLERQIYQSENKCLVCTTAKSAQSFSCIIKSVGFLGSITSLAQLYFDGFDSGSTEDGIFTGLALVFGAILTCGLTIECVGERFFRKAMKLRNLNWREKKILKQFVKVLDEASAMSRETNLRKADRTFNKLSNKSNILIPIIDEVDLINFLLDRLPEDHPIKLQLHSIEQFKQNPHFSLPSSASTRAETSITDEEPELLEEDIETIPNPTDMIVDYCTKELESGNSFERGVLKRIRLEEGEKVSDDLKRLITNVAEACTVWTHIEQYSGHQLPRLIINGSEIKREKIFPKNAYQEYRRRTSVTVTAIEESEEEEFEESLTLWETITNGFRKIHR